MSPTREIIIEILQEVDESIKELMLKKVDGGDDEYWMYLQNPAMTILEWQKMRDRRESK